MSTTNKRLGKIQQLDFLLLRKIEEHHVSPHPPTKPHVSMLPDEHNDVLVAYRDYWQDKGRKEGLMEARVLLREQGYLKA